MRAKDALTFLPRLTKTRTLWQPSTLIAAARVSAHFPKRMCARGFAQDVLQEPISAGAKGWLAGRRSHNFLNSRSTILWFVARPTVVRYAPGYFPVSVQSALE